ncbi:hypothetical protein AJ78_05065 [Emergomyces pasteurianus Ep9510]|uniref:Tafazzin n=1 Tax=Emergomyces pasteurianus Ep9510 TaxID=1447872 RepID=A0A1J9QHC2_9EURO|nr:hypothetical protein AJ78_05065 [Emergomyces pasteurianus Ep9510]
MPKKHHKPTTPKPNTTVHPSLTSFASSKFNNVSPKTKDGQSVNDLIHHLRRTQLTKHEEVAASLSRVAPRSVHPSIRNLLELPVTPPPRPRPGTRRVGERRVRRTPGPAEPLSWLVPNDASHRQAFDEGRKIIGNDRRERNIRLDRLPGAHFPATGSLQHMVLKSMALHWDSHLLYDGAFLSELPTPMRQMLLSYVATYTDHSSMEVGMKGFKPLFFDYSDNDNDTISDVTRLDLGSSLGRWMTFKQLSREIKGPDRPESRARTRDNENAPPSSWEEEADPGFPMNTIPRTPTQPLHQRFSNLKYLSLANPTHREASWPSLLNLLSHLSTITHLSLAYWPTPTLTPNALTASMKHQKLNSLTFAYGGTDMYSAFENNWVEAAGVLRRLSKITYCLKWLDLEGCSDWLPALSWNGIDLEGNFHAAAGPEWNSAWRGLEWLGLDPGWFPDVSDAEDSYLIYERDKTLLREIEIGCRGSPRIGATGIEGQMARIKERDEYRKLIERAVEVKKQVQAIRMGGGGRWLEVSLGQEREDELRMRVCGDRVK